MVLRCVRPRDLVRVAFAKTDVARCLLPACVALAALSRLSLLLLVLSLLLPLLLLLLPLALLLLLPLALLLLLLLALLFLLPLALLLLPSRSVWAALHVLLMLFQPAAVFLRVVGAVSERTAVAALPVLAHRRCLVPVEHFRVLDDHVPDLAPRHALMRVVHRAALLQQLADRPLLQPRRQVAEDQLA